MEQCMGKKWQKSVRLVSCLWTSTLGQYRRQKKIVFARHVREVFVWVRLLSLLPFLKSTPSKHKMKANFFVGWLSLALLLFAQISSAQTNRIKLVDATSPNATETATHTEVATTGNSPICSTIHACTRKQHSHVHHPHVCLCFLLQDTHRQPLHHLFVFSSADVRNTNQQHYFNGLVICTILSCKFLWNLCLAVSIYMHT